MSRLIRFMLILVLLAGVLLGLVYTLTWRPAPREELPVACSPADKAPRLIPGQALKVMTWNIQYLAGKRYVFWYDMTDGSGPDERPTPEDVAFNLDEVAR
ncbi:MAG: endonuclease/exonuclease/phosphatase family protein, partial [Pseudomonas caspiana]